MRDGLLWFDNSDRSLADKIERAAEYFKTKYGERPDLCFVNASALLRELPALDGIEVRGTNSVLPNHLWMGFGNKSLPVPV